MRTDLATTNNDMIIKYERDLENLRNRITFINEYFFERDRMILLDLYRDYVKAGKYIPELSSLFNDVMDSNYDIIYESQEMYFFMEIYDDFAEEIRNDILSQGDYSEQYILEQIQDMSYECISENASETFNDLYMWESTRIIEQIRNILDSENQEYVDDHLSAPYFVHGIINPNEYNVYKNDCQRLLLPSLQVNQLSFIVECTDDENDALEVIIRRKQSSPRKERRSDVNKLSAAQC